MNDQTAQFSVRPIGAAGRIGFLLTMAWLATGCREKGAIVPPAAPQPASVTDYVLRGVVRSIVPAAGKVLIRHEAIPNFMAAMPMWFKPANTEILATLHAGDRVEGTLRVEKEDGAVKDYQLLDLKVTKPAEPAAGPPEVSKRNVQVGEQSPRLKVGEPLPDFTMATPDGKTLKFSDLRGKVVVLTFIYTRCPMPDYCPMMDRSFSKLAEHISAFPNRAKDIRLISLSFDPEHDTLDVLRKHALLRGAVAPLWRYAVASHEELAKVAGPLGLFLRPDGGEIAHNLCTAVIDPRGNLARLEVGTQANRWETADFLKTIYSLPPGAK